MRTPTRLLVAAVVVCIVLSTSFVHGVTSSGAPTVRVEQTEAQAFKADFNEDGRVTWHDALCALMSWIIQSGDVEIP